MESFSGDLTQLENELYEKVKVIKKHLYETKYNPKRVEPGIGFDLGVESKWSKFVGETLFINQKLLNEVHFRNAIFWREALLLFVPKQMRDSWWVRLIANAYPLSIRLSNIEYEKWEKLWRKTSPDLQDYIDSCKLLISSAGSLGLLEVLRQGLYQTLYQHEELMEKRMISKPTSDLDPHEMEIILSNTFQESINISDNAIDIMNIALIKQTTKPKELEKNLSLHYGTIAKTVKKLLEMNVLLQKYSINYLALGLTQFMVLLICTKKQRVYFRTPIRNPFLYTHKFICLNACVITQFYVGPKTKDYYKKLINYCQNLKEKNQIVEFHVFELHSAFRSYWFKYFNTRTKSLNFNLNDIAIESDLFDNFSIETHKEKSKLLGNIVIPTRIVENKYLDLDYLDLKILNQFMTGVYNRRAIQKNIKKDMNETVQRIKKLFENKIIYEDIQVVLPRSDGEISAYLEVNSNKISKNHNNLRERIINFCYHLPHVYCGEINGTFNGLMLFSRLPSSITMGMAELFNWFLPDGINTQIIVGRPEIQKDKDELFVSRWNNGEWIVSEDDFEL
ncbi:MAG: hypothetical protein KGD59_03440 [Candidatus Heimdallarchaeota archaeon]|nr:hypothetical protein [Candidatus Heimdallarchaeota archaeon]MBY8993578.1 hypothetical protein [Candidatus Heimdallarchaeota archaeon]